MSDWQIGDLALCVKVGPWKSIGTEEDREAVGVRGGGIYTVRNVGQWEAYTIIWLAGFGGASVNDAFVASRFRKITPPTADEFDRETIELMNRVEQPA